MSLGPEEQQSLLKLLSEVLSQPSVTPKDEGCQALLSEYLSEEGFNSQFINRGETTNVLIRKGIQKPFFLFAGHTDVVPAGKGWNTDPFTPTIVDGLLTARGAQDMKTSDVCFAVAAKLFVEHYPSFEGSIGMLLTSDEEGDGLDGTVYAIEELKKQNVTPDYCIVGEPTSSKVIGDTIKNGRRGSLNCKLIIHGEQGHVAYPQRVENPIHQAGKLIAALTAVVWDNGYPDFPPTSFQISNIHSGTGAVNVIPGSCELLFNFRFSPAVTDAQIISRVESLVAKYCSDSEIKWTRSAFPFRSKGETLISSLSKAIKETTTVKPTLSTSGGTSDARFISQWCPEVLEFGPVNDKIHKANESIPLKDISTLAEIYYKTLVNIFIHKAHEH